MLDGLSALASLVSAAGANVEATTTGQNKMMGPEARIQ